MRCGLLFWTMTTVVTGTLLAQAPEALKSGPQVGSRIPHNFDPININGVHKNRPHCLITKFGIEPTVVMVFAREPGEGKDGPLTEFISKLDEKTVGFEEDQYFCSFVVFLSPAARDSTTDPKEEDVEKLIAEAQARQALLGRLADRAKDLKKTILGCYPESPWKKDDKNPQSVPIHDKAELTIIVYRKLDVVGNFTFAEGQFRKEDVDGVLTKIDKLLPKRKI